MYDNISNHAVCVCDVQYLMRVMFIVGCVMFSVGCVMFSVGCLVFFLGCVIFCARSA